MQVNQYFISNKPFQTPKNGKLITIGEFSIWAHENLGVTEYTSESVHLILLGFFVHPDSPQKKNEDILTELSSFTILSKEFFHFLNQLVGRFVLIVRKENNFIILNDSRAQRQIFYFYKDNDLYITSSPKLFYDLTNFEFHIPKDKQVILSSKRYKVLDEWFPGDEYLDNHLKRLIPNFYLDIYSREAKRIPFSILNMSKKNLKDYIKKQIIGAAEACAYRYENILFAVTGGSDSRLILSLNPSLKNASYFIYDREEKNSIDVKISKELTDKKGIILNIVKPKELSNGFLSFYKNQFLYPRIISKTQNFEWLSKNCQTAKSIVITGYSGEIYRNKILSVNPYHKKFQTPEDFIDYFHYPKSQYLERMLKDWLDSARNYIKDCNHLTLPELFYWEIHVAYSAQYVFEQDVSGVEMFCPLSNRQMILNLIHNTTAEERSAPNGIIYQIINETSPQWKDIPYNPKPFHKKLKDTIFNLLPLSMVNRLINR